MVLEPQRATACLSRPFLTTRAAGGAAGWAAGPKGVRVETAAAAAAAAPAARASRRVMIAMAQNLCAPARGVNAYARAICNPATGTRPSAAHNSMANQIMISFTSRGRHAEAWLARPTLLEGMRRRSVRAREPEP